MRNSKKTYEKRVNKYSQLLTKLSKTINTISILRLGIGIFIIISSIYSYKVKESYIPKAILLVLILTFIYLVVMHRKYRNANSYIDILKQINLSSIKRLNGEWIRFEDIGKDFLDEKHRYSGDLDIFGQGSLFQWINTANTHMGRERLAKTLTHTRHESYFTKEAIDRRQEAIEELANKLWWRQKLQAEVISITKKDQYKENNFKESDFKDNKYKDELIEWLNSKNKIYSNIWLIVMLRLLPIVTITTMVLGYRVDIISKYIPTILIFFQALLICINSKYTSIEASLAYKYQKSIKAYEKVLSHLEKGKFDSVYINRLKDKLLNNNGVTVTKQLKQLERIVDSILNRNNLYFFPINIITLWDYQSIISLEKWKRESGILVKAWLNVIGEIEALSSLANIRYDNPNWTSPEITEKPSVFNGKLIGHPLLINDQVCNDVNINDPSRILLITGSNMSGKSTLLRTIGINMVLAYSGAPVCASFMKTSIMSIYTCMRTSDNLEKGISSFYGELLRIKDIVSSSKEDKQIFFLLDEIFKGTNSYDRHIGASMLIKQLYKNNAMGLVSTHDLELGELEEESKGNIKNYHFQEYYEDGKIKFDYKLREGVSNTRNALYLIKMAGIEV